MPGHIAIVTPICPYPPNSGTRLRIHFLMKHLVENGFDVSLIICAPNALPQTTADQLRGMCDNLLIVPPEDVNMTTSRPRQFVRRAIGSPVPDRPAMRQAIHKAFVELAPDFVQAEKTFTCAQLNIMELQRAGIAVVLEEGGVHHLAYEREARTARGFTRWKLARRARRLHDFEAKLLGQVDAVTAVSAVEARILKEMNGNVTVIPAPNGVDDDIFLADPPDLSSRERSIFFCGSLSYKPNADAVRFWAQDIAPCLQADLPGTELLVAGGDAPQDIRDMANDTGPVRLLGHVADISSCFRQYRAMLNCMRLGGGTNLKLLEAMAHGMACVSTTLGAEGIDVENGTHISIADSPDDLARAIVRLLRDDDHAESLASNARQLAKNRYRWSDCVAELVNYYSSRAAPDTG